MDAADWQSIPAENLVAAFQVQLLPACLMHLAGRTYMKSPMPSVCSILSIQDSAVKLMATAVSADDARVKLEALERGVDGVLLRTDDPVQVRAHC